MLYHVVSVVNFIGVCKMKTLYCACCGSEVTCPQFFDGKIYGYSCITKVDPSRIKSKKKFLPYEFSKVSRFGNVLENLENLPINFDVTIIYKGKKFNCNVSKGGYIFAVDCNIVFINEFYTKKFDKYL